MIERSAMRCSLGLDRTPCARCGHRHDMHVDRDGVLVCVVCDRSATIWPCSPERLGDEQREAQLPAQRGSVDAWLRAKRVSPTSNAPSIFNAKFAITLRRHNAFSRYSTTRIARCVSFNGGLIPPGVARSSLRVRRSSRDQSLLHLERAVDGFRSDILATCTVKRIDIATYARRIGCPSRKVKITRECVGLLLSHWRAGR